MFNVLVAACRQRCVESKARSIVGISFVPSFEYEIASRVRLSTSESLFDRPHVAIVGAEVDVGVQVLQDLAFVDLLQLLF